MAKVDRSAGLRVLAGVCGNLAAAWFGLILLAPEFDLFSQQENLIALTRSLLFGMVFLVLAFVFEKRAR